MNKFFVGIVILAMFLGLSIQALAAQSDSLTVKVTILSTLSVDITETEIILDDVEVGGTTVSAAEVTVTNTGSGIAETYSLNLTNPDGWTASQIEPDVETYVLNGCFDLDGTLTWDAVNHALSITPVACSSTKFAGDQTGVSVPYGEARKLWFQFQAPMATSVTTQQGITVTITAQAS